MSKTLASIPTAKRGVPPDDVPRELFRKGVGPWKWPLVCLLHSRGPEIFRADWEVVNFLATTTNLAQFEDVIDTVHARLIGERPFWRGTFGLRISARRLNRLAREVF